jgi:hypothetical protein
VHARDREEIAANAIAVISHALHHRYSQLLLQLLVKRELVLQHVAATSLRRHEANAAATCDESVATPLCEVSAVHRLEETSIRDAHHEVICDDGAPLSRRRHANAAVAIAVAQSDAATWEYRCALAAMLSASRQLLLVKTNSYSELIFVDLKSARAARARAGAYCRRQE